MIFGEHGILKRSPPCHHGPAPQTQPSESSFLHSYLEAFKEVEQTAKADFAYFSQGRALVNTRSGVAVIPRSYLPQGPLGHQNLSFLSIESIERGGAIVNYKAIINQFSVDLRLLNLDFKAENYGKQQQVGRGNFGKAYLVKVAQSADSNLIAKRIKFVNNSNQDPKNTREYRESSRFWIKQTLMEIALYKICSFLKIGPQTNRKILGFDVLAYQDCIEFYMEKCESRHTMPSIFKLPRLQNRLKYCLRMLHLFQIVHKDIKPDNILFSPSLMDFVLTDFGISQALKQPLGFKSNTCYEGTEVFMSEEMAILKILKENETCKIDLYYNDLCGLQQTLKIIKAINARPVRKGFPQRIANVLMTAVQSDFYLLINKINLLLAGRSTQLLMKDVSEWMQKLSAYFPELTTLKHPQHQPSLFASTVDSQKIHINKKFIQRSTWVAGELNYEGMRREFGTHCARLIHECQVATEKQLTNFNRLESFLIFQRLRLLNNERKLFDYLECEYLSKYTEEADTDLIDPEKCHFRPRFHKGNEREQSQISMQLQGSESFDIGADKSYQNENQSSRHSEDLHSSTSFKGWHRLALSGVRQKSARRQNVFEDNDEEDTNSNYSRHFLYYKEKQKQPPGEPEPFRISESLSRSRQFLQALFKYFDLNSFLAKKKLNLLRSCLNIIRNCAESVENCILVPIQIQIREIMLDMLSENKQREQKAMEMVQSKFRELDQCSEVSLFYFLRNLPLHLIDLFYSRIIPLLEISKIPANSKFMLFVCDYWESQEDNQNLLQKILSWFEVFKINRVSQLNLYLRAFKHLIMLLIGVKNWAKVKEYMYQARPLLGRCIQGQTIDVIQNIGNLETPEKQNYYYRVLLHPRSALGKCCNNEECRVFGQKLRSAFVQIECITLKCQGKVDKALELNKEYGNSVQNRVSEIELELQALRILKDEKDPSLLQKINKLLDKLMNKSKISCLAPESVGAIQEVLFQKAQTLIAMGRLDEASDTIDEYERLEEEVVSQNRRSGFKKIMIMYNRAEILSKQERVQDGIYYLTVARQMVQDSSFPANLRKISLNMILKKLATLHIANRNGAEGLRLHQEYWNIKLPCNPSEVIEWTSGVIQCLHILQDNQRMFKYIRNLQMQAAQPSRIQEIHQELAYSKGEVLEKVEERKVFQKSAQCCLSEISLDAYCNLTSMHMTLVNYSQAYQNAIRSFQSLKNLQSQASLRKYIHILSVFIKIAPHFNEFKQILQKYRQYRQKVSAEDEHRLVLNYVVPARDILNYYLKVAQITRSIQSSLESDDPMIESYENQLKEMRLNFMNILAVFLQREYRSCLSYAQECSIWIISTNSIIYFFPLSRPGEFPSLIQQVALGSKSLRFSRQAQFTLVLAALHLAFFQYEWRHNQEFIEKCFEIISHREFQSSCTTDLQRCRMIFLRGKYFLHTKKYAPAVYFLTKSQLNYKNCFEKLGEQYLSIHNLMLGHANKQLGKAFAHLKHLLSIHSSTVDEVQRAKVQKDIEAWFKMQHSKKMEERSPENGQIPNLMMQIRKKMRQKIEMKHRYSKNLDIT